MNARRGGIYGHPTELALRPPRRTYLPSFFVVVVVLRGSDAERSARGNMYLVEAVLLRLRPARSNRTHEEECYFRLYGVDVRAPERKAHGRLLLGKVRYPTRPRVMMSKKDLIRAAHSVECATHIFVAPI